MTDDPLTNDDYCEDDDLPDLNVPILFGRFLAHSGVIDAKTLERTLRVQAKLNHQSGFAALDAESIAPDDCLACRPRTAKSAHSFPGFDTGAAALLSSYQLSWT